MIFTKESQQKICNEFFEKNPKATIADLEIYMQGVSRGIKEHVKYVKDFNPTLKGMISV